MELINIVDWFDPLNLEHINSYKNLRKTGTMVLPEGVDANTLDFTMNWQIEVMGKLANAWVDNFHRMELVGPD